jgi:hypothetical protein
MLYPPRHHDWFKQVLGLLLSVAKLTSLPISAGRPEISAHLNSSLTGETLERADRRARQKCFNSTPPVKTSTASEAHFP